MRLQEKLLAVIAAAFMAVPVVCFAQSATRLTDAELDQITAGDASSIKVIFNPSDNSKEVFHRNNTFDINPVPLPGQTPPTPTAGTMFIFNNGHPEGMQHCIGGPSAAAFFGC